MVRIKTIVLIWWNRGESIKSRSGLVEPSPAALIRAAFDGFDPLYSTLPKKTTLTGGPSFWWSRRSTSSDHQIIKGLHLLVPWRFFFAWMMCFYCVMCLCHYYLSFSVYSICSSVFSFTYFIVHI